MQPSGSHRWHDDSFEMKRAGVVLLATHSPRPEGGGDALPPDRSTPDLDSTSESNDVGLRNVDLQALRSVLRRACGTSAASAVMGRKRLRDEVVRHLGCSALTAGQLVDAMVERGLICQQVHRDGWVYWVMS